MVLGCWVGDPLPVSFFLFSSVFCSALHPLWAHQLPGLEFRVAGLEIRSLFLLSPCPRSENRLTDYPCGS